MPESLRHIVDLTIAAGDGANRCPCRVVVRDFDAIIGAVGGFPPQHHPGDVDRTLEIDNDPLRVRELARPPRGGQAVHRTNRLILLAFHAARPGIPVESEIRGTARRDIRSGPNAVDLHLPKGVAPRRRTRRAINTQVAAYRVQVRQVVRAAIALAGRPGSRWQPNRQPSHRVVRNVEFVETRERDLPVQDHTVDVIPVPEIDIDPLRIGGTGWTSASRDRRRWHSRRCTPALRRSKQQRSCPLRGSPAPHPRMTPWSGTHPNCPRCPAGARRPKLETSSGWFSRLSKRRRLRRSQDPQASGHSGNRSSGSWCAR